MRLAVDLTVTVTIFKVAASITFSHFSNHYFLQHFIVITIQRTTINGLSTKSTVFGFHHFEIILSFWCLIDHSLSCVEFGVVPSLGPLACVELKPNEHEQKKKKKKEDNWQ